MIRTLCLEFFLVAFGSAGPWTALGTPGIKLRTVNVHADSKDYPTFSAVVGRSVALPCNVTPPTQDDGISLVLWYRGESGSPIYTMDFRASSLDKASHFAHDVLGNRAAFNMTARPSALYINPLKESDAAEYRCRVDFRRARTKNRIMKLVIITPTSGISIRTPSNQTTTGLIGPFNEGSPLSLVCEAKGGKPPPVVSWWREATLLDETYEVSAQRLVLNQLTLVRLQRSDLMATLTCQASNTNMSVPLAVSVTIDMNLKPQDTRIITNRQSLSAGKKYEIKCQATGSRPAAKISWWREKEELSQSQESYSSDGSITDSFLSFVPSSSDNGKKLTCRAQNAKMFNSTLEDAWNLNVFYRPVLSLALGASVQDSNIAEGSEVYFDCNIQSNPPITAVTWLLDERPLVTDKDFGVIINNKSLVIREVRREHRGKYQCSAVNLEGEGYSDQVMLYVKFAPVCKEDQKYVYGVARHETSTITCEVEADPPQVHFSWRFNNSDESIDVVSYTKSGTISQAKYTPHNKMDYGILTCWGRNSVGSQVEPCVFNIVAAGRPEPVENCSVLNQTATSLYLECESGDDGGLQQQFHLEVRAGDELQANVTSFDAPIFYADSLSPGSTFMLSIYASNPKGRSSVVDVTATTLFLARRRIGDTPAILVSPVLAVLLGIVGLLVLLAIIIILIMKRRAQEEIDESSEQATLEKLQGPLTVDKEMRMDGEERCPDIIPPNNFITGERIYENLRPDKEPTYENIIKRVHFKTKESDGELTYAELILPNCGVVGGGGGGEARMIRREAPPTEYADISFQPRRRDLPPASELDGPDLPLMCNKYLPPITEVGLADNGLCSHSAPV